MNPDAEYLAAVERGDMDTARRLMIDHAVSKGYVPVEVYHGTRKRFWTFDATKGKPSQPSNFIRDAVRTPQFFSFDEDFAKDYATFDANWRDVKKVRLIKAFLKYEKLWDYRNPADVDAAVEAGFPRWDIEKGSWGMIESSPFQRWLLENGYDAFTNFERFAVNIAVFKPWQIKSAETVSMKGSKIIPLSKRFDVTKDDIRNPRTPDSDMDSEYLAAVERGDMNAAQRMVDEAAKRAADACSSDLTDERGRPIVFQHATNSDWNIYDLNRGSIDKQNKGSGPAIWLAPFGSTVSSTRTGSIRIKKLYAFASNALVLNDDADLKKASKTFGSGELGSFGYFVLPQTRKNLLDAGYDAVIWNRKDNRPPEIIVFHPCQIKSADPVTRDDEGNIIPLSKRFDMTKDDIRNPRTPDSITVIEDRPVEPRDMPYSAGSGVRRGNRKVVINVYGNLHGYEGRQRVISFADDYDAADWLNGVEKEIPEGPIRLRGLVNPRSTPPQFPYDYAAYLKKNFPKVWAKGGNIRGNDTFRWWTAYRQGDRSPTVMHWWNVTRPAWIARHFRDHRLPGVIAQIKWGTVGTLGVAGMKRVVEDAIRHEIR